MNTILQCSMFVYLLLLLLFVFYFNNLYKIALYCNLFLYFLVLCTLVSNIMLWNVFVFFRDRVPLYLSKNQVIKTISNVFFFSKILHIIKLLIDEPFFFLCLLYISKHCIIAGSINYYWLYLFCYKSIDKHFKM